MPASTFRTPISPTPHPGWLSHDDAILMLGSCFSDNIGKRLAEEMFNVVANPFGALYNPTSIAEAIHLILSHRDVDEQEMFFHRGVWRHFMCHTSLAHPDRSIALVNINEALSRSRALLQQARQKSLVLAITLGSSWVYMKGGKVVANCHTLPAAEFSRRMLTVNEATGVLADAIEALRIVVPDLKVLITVSPVRHLDSGLQGNSLSKAVLRLAANDLVNNLNNAIYFPAFEILNDDLRDYRFYADDMLHPSSTAISYIYSLLRDSLMTPATIALADDCRKLHQRANHRPLSGLGDPSLNDDLHRLSLKILSRHSPLPPHIIPLLTPNS